MKKLKAILALVLVAALMLTLFAACGNSEQADDPGTGGQTGGNETGGNETGGNETGGQTGEIDYGEEEDEEMATIEFYFFDLRMTGADYGEHVVEAINEITEERINTHVNITYMVIGDWTTKVQLAIGGGEQVDVMGFQAGNGISTMYTNTMAMDITDYMQQYAPETLELLADFLGPYTYDGRLYGLPTYRNFCANGYIIMRKDILEEVGMLELGENLSTWSDFETILAAVNEKYAGTGLYPISKGAGGTVISGNGTAVGGDNFSEHLRWDILGDATGMVFSDNDGNVGLYPAMPEYEAELQMVKEWYDNGWVYPDSTIIDTHGDELMKQGVAFATVQGSEVGIEVVKSSSIGYEVVCPMRYEGMITTGQLTSWGIGVPITAEEPEAACKFLNLMYTDAEIMNLLIWGVEGVDYTMQDDQVVLNPNGGYYQADFLIGNNTLLKPLYGNGADFFDNVAKINESAYRSPYLGFSLATGELDLVISQITAVTDQYLQSLCCGEYTPEAYQAYLAALEAAGVQDYLDEVQTQLDDWLAAH